MLEKDELEKDEIKSIVESLLFVSEEPLSIVKLASFFDAEAQVDNTVLRDSIETLQKEYEGRAVELVELASGYAFRVRQMWSAWVRRLWQEKPPKYSRAFLETLVLIAYRQPITRAEIEEIRGVSVSSNIIKMLQELGWVRAAGHRELPGRPEILVTTKTFLDHFNLKILSDLPPLHEMKDIDSFQIQ